MTGPNPTREWFRDWFGEEYLALYPHRDEREAREAVDLFRDVVPPVPPSRILDLACGAGRHLRELRDAGFAAIGLDLSMPLLRSARSSGEADPLVRGDMRELPFGDAAFDGLTSFFTSFGYFADPEDDRRVLLEMERVLAQRGAFMLDFMNAARVRKELVSKDCRELDGKQIVQTREIADGVVVKRIRIESPEEGKVRRFEERVRLYTCDELVSLLAGVGLLTRHQFGDYRGAPFAEGSPRLILAGRKSHGGNPR